MCFGDGVRYTTGCAFGKGNIREDAHGKLAFTLIEKDTNRAVRVSNKPALQKQISKSEFMTTRGLGVMPDDIPEAEQIAMVDLTGVGVPGCHVAGETCTGDSLR